MEKKGREEGAGSGENDCLQRFSLLVLASFRGPFAVRRLGSALRLFFSAIGFIFYLSGSQSWPPLKQDLEKTEAPRVALLEVMTVGPVLPSCPPRIQEVVPRFSQIWRALE